MTRQERNIIVIFLLFFWDSEAYRIKVFVPLHFYLALHIPVLPSKWRNYSHLLNMSLNLFRCIELGTMTGPSCTHSLPQHKWYPLLPMKLTGNSIFLLQLAQIHILRITMDPLDNMLWLPSGRKVWRPH